MADDRTSYTQSLTHMIKGNLGAGLLGMGSSFAHLGLMGALIVLPGLCLMSSYCVHLLIKSAQFVELRSSSCSSSSVVPSSSSSSSPSASPQLPVLENRNDIDYATLARRALRLGPAWAHRFSKPLARVVDSALLLTQVGVCCVYIVFVVDNVTSILASYDVHVTKSMAFAGIFPITLLLSFVRTLKRLALASMAANLLQFIGLALIVEFLARDLGSVHLRDRDNFRPLGEMALGFGSTMFAFEGISVVLPIYSRMRRPKLMASQCGIINISFIVILVLYFLVGFLSYLKYGHHVRDSITLNLPAEPLYDLVRAMFTTSILLTYPLQFYVPNEMIWKWTKRNLLSPPQLRLAASAAQGGLEIVVPSCQVNNARANEQAKKQPRGAAAAGSVQLNALELAKSDEAAGLFRSLEARAQLKDKDNKFQVDQLIKSIQDTAAKVASERAAAAKSRPELEQLHHSKAKKLEEEGLAASCRPADDGLLSDDKKLLRYEYYCRMVVVAGTFTLAASVPKLNLLMDLIGSFSGAALSLTIPAAIHLAVCWQSSRGFKKCSLVLIDVLIIVFSFCAGLGGSISSLFSIIRGH